MTNISTRSIGAFVVGAALLLVGAVALFVGSDFFEKERKFVAYFDRSVNGLNVGAPIKFRGIPIGEVAEIEGVYDQTTNDVRPRVILVVNPERMTNAKLEGDEYSLFRGLVENGMRASLKSQSMLTGQLYVSLDFYENEPVRLLGNVDDEHPEMPTVETGLGEFLASIQELPIDKVISQLGTTLASLDKILSNDSLTQTIDRLPQLVSDLDRTAQGFGRFARNDLPRTTTQMQSFLAASENSVEQLSDRINDESLANLDNTLGEIDKTLVLLRDRLGPNDPLTLELTNAMRDISDTAVSVRRLTEFLETHPEALIRGRNQ